MVVVGVGVGRHFEDEEKAMGLDREGKCMSVSVFWGFGLERERGRRFLVVRFGDMREDLRENEDRGFGRCECEFEQGARAMIGLCV